MIERKKFKHWYDEKEGFLHVNVLERYDPESTELFFSDMGQYPEEQQRYVLCFVDDDAQKLVDKETRKVAAEKGKVIKWGNIAIWGAKPGLRMVAKIVLTAVGKGRDLKFFDNEEDCVTWLKERQQKDASK
jgi:hypothetical protein